MAKGEHLGGFEQLVLLGLIRLKRNAYGMTVRRELAERTGRDVAIGAVYTALERMEGKGFVSSWWGEGTPERGGRPKRFFKIEAPGIAALNEAQNALGRMWDGVVVPVEGGA